MRTTNKPARGAQLPHSRCACIFWAGFLNLIWQLQKSCKKLFLLNIWTKAMKCCLKTETTEIWLSIVRINKFDLLRAGVKTDLNTDPSGGEANIHLCSWDLIFNLLKYVCKLLTTLNSFSNPFSLITNWGGDHHSPQRKREKGEKYTLRNLATYSFWFNIAVIYGKIIRQWKKEKKKIYFLSNK